MANSISLITINLNNAEGLRDTLNSIHFQEERPFEHIIIDGGSTDHSLTVINDYNDKISNYVTSKDDGIYCAMNKGASISKGEWIGFLNSGDIFYPEVISELSHELDQDCYDFTIGDVVIADINKNKIYKKTPIFNNDGMLSSMEMPAAHMSIFVRRSIFNEIGGFDENLKISSDFDFVNRLLAHSQKYYSIKKTVGEFYLGGVSENITRLQEDLIVLRKHNPSKNLHVLMLRKYLSYCLGVVIPVRLRVLMKKIFKINND